MVQIENSIRPCHNILNGECAGINATLVLGQYFLRRAKWGHPTAKKEESIARFDNV